MILETFTILFWIILLYVLPSLPFTFILFHRESLPAKVSLAFGFGILMNFAIGGVMYYYGNYDMGKTYIVFFIIVGMLTLIAIPFGKKHIQHWKSTYLRSKIRVYAFIRNRLGDVPSYIMLFAVIFFLLTRFSDPIFRFSLNASDPYEHYKIVAGILWANATYEESGKYYAGFHLIVAQLQIVSRVELYTIMKVLGPIFSLFSLVSIYALIKRLSNLRETAALGILAFAGFPFLSRWFYWQTLSVPDVLAFSLLPIPLILFFSLLSPKNKDIWDKIIYVGALICVLVILLFLHRLTIAALVYLLFLMFMTAPLILQNRFYSWKIVFPVGVLVTIFVIAFFLANLYIDEINYVGITSFTDFIWDVLKPKRFDLTVANAVGFVLVSVTFALGIIKRRYANLYFGLAGIFFSIAHITGIFYPSAIQYREGLIYAFLVAMCLGCIWYEIISKEGLYVVAKKILKKEIDFKLISHIHYSTLIAGIVGYLIYALTGVLYLGLGVLLIGFFSVFFRRKRLFREKSFFFGEKLNVQKELIDKEYWHEDDEEEQEEYDDSPSPRLIHTVKNSGYYKLTFLTLILLIFVFPPPEYSQTYYHYGYDGVMEAALQIQDDYDINNVTVYHETELVERNKIDCLYHPYGNVIELRYITTGNASGSDPGSWERPDVFFFIEKEPLESIQDFEGLKNYEIIFNRRTSIQENATGWIERFNTTHNIDIYFENDDIWVYHYRHGDWKID